MIEKLYHKNLLEPEVRKIIATCTAKDALLAYRQFKGLGVSIDMYADALNLSSAYTSLLIDVGETYQETGNYDPEKLKYLQGNVPSFPVYGGV